MGIRKGGFMMKKKLILAGLILGITLNMQSNIDAANRARDMNDKYYNGNINYEYMRLNGGATWYIDKSSLVIIEKNDAGVKFAFNYIIVDYLKDDAPIVKYDTMWYYYPWNDNTNGLKNTLVRRSYDSKWKGVSMPKTEGSDLDHGGFNAAYETLRSKLASM